MAEYTYTGEQTVAQNGNVLFNETAVNGSNCIKHREGSGIYIDVPNGCCVNIAVENTSSQAVNVINSNIIVTRVA